MFVIEKYRMPFEMRCKISMLSQMLEGWGLKALDEMSTKNASYFLCAP